MLVLIRICTIMTVSKHTFTNLLRSCNVRGGRGKVYRKSMVSTIASTTGTSLRPERIHREEQDDMGNERYCWVEM